MRMTKHICPRDCYDTCSMISHVDGFGKLLKVTGDSTDSYTQGKLCCKGYSYTQYVYSPQRLIYPMRQEPRFSGNWQRISWDEALEIIAGKMIGYRKVYGSFLPFALLKGPGNYGVLSNAMEFLLRSLGPFTLATGSLCIAAGWDAQFLDFGGVKNRDPERMANTKLLILWGVNPAATAIHQMATIQRLKERGGKVVLIDILPTATSLHCDEFVRVRPGGDGALALAILRQMVIDNTINYLFVKKYTFGWEPFSEWLLQVDPQELQAISGVNEQHIKELAQQIAGCSPVAFWPGSGLQRYANGGQNMRAISALAAASGNMDSADGGLYFQNIDFWRLNNEIFSSAFTNLYEPRLVGVNALAEQLAACENPPIKMLWFASSNYLARGSDILKMRKQIAETDLTVTVDHFLTSTAEVSDIVLPAATCFEAADLVAGYWNNKIGINQQAIQPIGECRSDLEIAHSLSKVLNSMEPGISDFPEKRQPEEWFETFSPWLRENTGIDDYKQLFDSRVPLGNLTEDADYVEDGAAIKYRFLAPEALKQDCPEIPILVAPLQAPPAYPYRFLTLHRAEHLNTQFSNMEWLPVDDLLEVWINPSVAQRLGIAEGDTVIIYNEISEIRMYAKFVEDLAMDTLITYSWYDLLKRPVNVLTKVQQTDLGRHVTGFPGVAYHDTFVNLTRGKQRRETKWDNGGF